MADAAPSDPIIQLEQDHRLALSLVGAVLERPVTSAATRSASW